MPFAPLFTPSGVAPEPPLARSRRREEIPDRFKWNLDDIFPTGTTWEAAYKELEAGIERYAALKGTLAQGPERLLEAFKLSEELGQLAYRVWYFPSLQYDEDQRDNAINARRQQVQILFARLAAGRVVVQPRAAADSARDRARRGWTAAASSRVYRFAIEDLYRQQEHVLDEAGERLMSLSSRSRVGAERRLLRRSRPPTSKFPTITLSTGDEVTLTYGQYRAILATQPRPGGSRSGVHGAPRDLRAQRSTPTRRSTTASAARLVPGARARLQDRRSTRRCTATTSRPSVVENLIETTQAGVEPLRRYHRLRRKALGVLDRTTSTTSRSRSSTFDKKYQYDDVLDWIVDVGRAARRRLPGADARGLRGRLDRRLRERRQAQRARTRRRCTARTRTCC